MDASAPDIELPNAGRGPDPLSLSRLAERDDVEAIVLLFQRDHHCRQCRQQVQAIDERYAEFTARNAWVLSILPEEKGTAQEWVDAYQLRLPVLADPNNVAADAYDQDVKFGPVGRISDLLARMPKTVVLDTREDRLEPRFVHEGENRGDRPSVEALLTKVDEVVDAELPPELEAGTGMDDT